MFYRCGNLFVLNYSKVTRKRMGFSPYFNGLIFAAKSSGWLCFLFCWYYLPTMAKRLKNYLA
jgi:hypothetical protein